MKLNPIGIIGGIILIISPFLAWVSAFIINVSLLDMVLQSGAGLGTDYLVILIVLVLLIVGGIVAFFKGLIGGIIGLVGVLVFTIYLLVIPDGSLLFSFLGIGYYLAWIGAIICIISIVWKKIAPAPPTPAPPPPPT
jgi:hypothetical protein